MKTHPSHLFTPSAGLHSAGWLLGAVLLASPALAMDHSLVISSYNGTQTCLTCHGPGGVTGDKAAELMQTSHWTWHHTNTLSTGETQELGKRNVINNYCVATASNEPRCTSCHVGIGWRDKDFDLNDPLNIDCLVCHDTTGTYKKTPTGAGAPDPAVDLLAVAKSVGPTSRATCGACHFYGGGGDAVKHGDLDSTMKDPPRTLDVHMGVDGANKQCAFCHAAGQHQVRGSRYSQANPDNALCEDCHTAAPHKNPDFGERLNTHTARVACQTCHIPAFARGGRATKMTWDWSTAGDRNPDGSDKVIKDADGNPIYHSKKGSFTWQANVIPEYRWFNGDVLFTTLEDTVTPDGIVPINRLMGDESDSRARIVPVKHFTGRQPYDAGNQTLVVPHLFPFGADDTDAYWKSYDWLKAVVAGMNYVEKPFSGELGWIETEMFWVENHMVAPKEQALGCTDCHTSRGRLDFLALGYPAERAATLQTMMGFDVAIALAPGAGGITLTWQGTPGYRYQVQTADQLGVAWTDAPDGERLPGDVPGDISWTDPLDGAPVTRFYRVLRTEQ